MKVFRFWHECCSRIITTHGSGNSMKNLWIPFFAILVSFLIVTGEAKAAALTSIENNQLDNWFGTDNDYTNIWHGEQGARAESFHAAADNAGPTVSVYDITTHAGNSYRIGGYTQVNWGAPTGYKRDDDAFIFNFTIDVKQTSQGGIYEPYALYVSNYRFPIFGAGHDIFGGISYIGNNHGGNYNGYSRNVSYDKSQGNIADGNSFTYFTINSLDVYTLSDPQPSTVPAPPALILILTGLISLLRKQLNG